jgi:AraC-like DNA-binding protein
MDAAASVHAAICDLAFTQPDPGLETFPTEALSAFMPWPTASGTVRECGERTACLSFRGGSIRHVRIATDAAAWGAGSASAGTTPACLYVHFVIAGEVEIGRSGGISVAQPGDLVLYDRPLPIMLRKGGSSYYEDLSFAVFRNQFPSLDGLESVFEHVIVLRRDDLLPPLSSSLAFLTDNMSSLSRIEVAATFNACVSLLPVAVAHSNRIKASEVGAPEAGHLLSALLDFVNTHVSDAGLSPHVAALNVGISVRYVHKLFAARKTTFRSYVTSKRLELVRKELISPSSRDHVISTLAYRCGFSDLSTFNRSFKRRYGVTPNRFRADTCAVRVVERASRGVPVGRSASAPFVGDEKASELQHVT